MLNRSSKKIPDKTKAGFTIVEVTLVTAFVAMLLIAIAVMITRVSAIFQKGLTIKAVNSVGRNLVEEFTSAINSAPSVDTVSLCNTLLSTNQEVCVHDGAYRYLYQAQSGNFTDTTTGLPTTVQYNGVFCTGNYSYIWNTHYGIESENSSNTLTLKYMDQAGNTVNYTYENNDPSAANPRPFRLIRIEDKYYRACSARVDTGYQHTYSNEIDITHLANGTTENRIPTPERGFLEDSNDTPLDLYEYTIFQPSQDSITMRSFFAGTFILATQTGNVNITRAGDYCDISNTDEKDANKHEGSGNLFDLGSNFNYCGINKFNFAARTAGSGI